MAKFNFEIADATEMAATIKRGGYHPTQDRRDNSELPLQVLDAISSTDLGPLIPQAMVEIMVEAQDPIMTLTPLLDRVQWTAGTREFKMPAIGTFRVERVAEGESYPEKRLQIGGALNTATIDKWGMALAFTEEAIDQSRWDLMGMHVREAGRAFVRKKEEGVANFLRQLGQVVFDNRNPTMSQKGTTRGRDVNLAQNGTITLDDLFDMYAQVLHTGYTPDLLLMHPLSWLMFIKDPILRAFAFQSGGGVIFGSFSGSAQNRFLQPGGEKTLLAQGSRNGGQGVPLNGSPSMTTKGSDYNTQLSSAPQIPSMFPYPLRIVVSPFMWYDPARKLTDIVMADSSALGAIVVAEDLTTDSWDDIKVDIKYMKFKERYGFLIYEEGMGVAVAKNIHVDTNYWTSEPPRGLYDPTTMPAYSPSTPVV